MQRNSTSRNNRHTWHWWTLLKSENAGNNSLEMCFRSAIFLHRFLSIERRWRFLSRSTALCHCFLLPSLGRNVKTWKRMKMCQSLQMPAVSIPVLSGPLKEYSTICQRNIVHQDHPHARWNAWTTESESHIRFHWASSSQLISCIVLCSNPVTSPELVEHAEHTEHASKCKKAHRATRCHTVKGLTDGSTAASNFSSVSGT